MKVKKIYRCGGGNDTTWVDYIAVSFHDRKTEYIVDDRKGSVKEKVKELLKKLKDDDTTK